jgi:hypothetical protein
MKLFSLLVLILCLGINITFSQKQLHSCNGNEGKWGITTISQYGNNPVILERNSTADLKCRVEYTINSSFLCPDINCNRSVKYKLISPNGESTSGILPLTAISTINGTYTLVLYGMCGTKSCSQCTLKFAVKCP